ncbi:TetR/AcrR family transcriptional regulator [Actinopolymorpha pittospori]|uniref:AcrR family transcriptional regulator n=1 Tax=Actinopolymorpha pittospori TaxID=648752 RepID=A0A927MZ04_9ACTN|nr:TetR/AcrR family transcriptional regulator [Actinopolymorpha pittospori]MBE1607303.1 AcrR family transcriptional regulator [Actinopolymorpha pittospori]
MTSFQRARSDEQREVRRRAILDTAAAMLAEMSVAQVSLNELSRRVGLAKSNVLRYFESREAVLFELANAKSREWLDDLDATLAVAIDADAPPSERGDQLARALATSLADHPVLCDLISSQAAVLERNVSREAAAKYKQDSIGHVTRLAELVRQRVPELGERDALRFTAAFMLTAGAMWTHSHPTAAVIAAYEADPSLAVWRLDFTKSLCEMSEVVISGLLARQSR